MKNKKIRLTKRVKHITPSLTLQITSQAKRMKSEGKDVVNLAAGEPDFDTPDCIKQAAFEAIKSGFTKYTPASGIRELKEAIVDKLKRDNQLDYAPEQIIASNGAKQAIFNAIQVLCQKGDEVIIPSPYWVSYPEMVRLAGAKPKIALSEEKNNFKLSEKSFKSCLTRRTRLIILNTPANPTGSVYQKEELEMVSQIAKSYNLYVISDEIYEKIIYQGSKHISFASLSKEAKDLTLTVNGFSKSHAMTGWRIGYLAGPEQIIRAIDKLQSHSTSNPCSISQKAALEALSQKEDLISPMLKEFQNRRDLIIGRLENLRELSYVVPGGAFYIFVNISKTGLDSLTFARRLLEETMVATVPGVAFGWDTHIRLSFATSAEDIEKGMDKIAGWVRRLPKKY